MITIKRINLSKSAISQSERATHKEKYGQDQFKEVKCFIQCTFHEVLVTGGSATRTTLIAEVKQR